MINKNTYKTLLIVLNLLCRSLLDLDYFFFLKFDKINPFLILYQMAQTLLKNKMLKC